MSPPIRWGGLDFNTAELDVEILAVLARIAPEGGDVRALPLTARVKDAARAVDQDLSMMRSERQRAAGVDLEDETADEQAMAEMYACLLDLADAQAALFAAHERLMNARRRLGDL